MSPDQLRAWIEARGLLQREAADMLGLSLSGLTAQLQRGRIGAQTALLCELLDQYNAQRDELEARRIEVVMLSRLLRPAA